VSFKEIAEVIGRPSPPQARLVGDTFG